MTTGLQDIYIEVFNKVNNGYRPFYNLYLQELYTKKCECFVKFGIDPISYYKCFDNVEKIVIKDKKTMKELQQSLQDQFTICKYDCKSTNEDALAACMKSCQNKLVGGLLGLYESFYSQKLGSKKEYHKLRMRQEAQ